MFNQLLTPVGDSLILSFLVAALPIVVVLVSLGVLRRPAWQSSLAGLAVALVIAIAVWTLMNVNNPDFSVLLQEVEQTEGFLPNTGQVVIEGQLDGQLPHGERDDQRDEQAGER